MQRFRLSLLCLIFLGCACFAPGVARAQDKSVFTPADTSSPRTTLRSFLENTHELFEIVRTERYLDRNSPEHAALGMQILDCLDQSQLPEFDRMAKASEVAVCIKEVLDRFEIPPFEEIPGPEEIEASGETLVRWRIPETRVTIVRIAEGPQKHEYLFSAGTVQRAVQHYHEVKGLPYQESGPWATPGLYEWYMTAPANETVASVVELLPDWFQTRSIGLARWKWVGFLLSAVLSLFLVYLLHYLHGMAVARYRDKHLFWYCLSIVLPIMAAIVPLIFVHFIYNYLSLRGQPLYVAGFFGNLLALFAAIGVVFGLSNRIAAVIIASPQINPQGLDAQFIRILTRILSVVAAVIVLLQGGQYLGIPIATLIASAGIGGLAVALAAQDTLRNLFGTIMLLTDKPFRVGERIVFGKYDGVVEEIGLRSTRIRLLTGHLATIPNDELARNDIENIGRRPYIRRVADLKLPLETSREKIEQAKATISRLLENHEGMDPEKPPRVYFTDFGADAYVIRLMYWYSPPEYWDFMAFGEQLNLDILKALEEQGIRLATPLRVTHTTVDSEPAPVGVSLLGDQPG